MAKQVTTLGTVFEKKKIGAILHLLRKELEPGHKIGIICDSSTINSASVVELGEALDSKE